MWQRLFRKGSPWAGRVVRRPSLPTGSQEFMLGKTTSGERWEAARWFFFSSFLLCFSFSFFLCSHPSFCLAYFSAVVDRGPKCLREGNDGWPAKVGLFTLCPSSLHSGCAEGLGHDSSMRGLRLIDLARPPRASPANPARSPWLTWMA